MIVSKFRKLKNTNEEEQRAAGGRCGGLAGQGTGAARGGMRAQEASSRLESVQMYFIVKSCWGRNSHF